MPATPASFEVGVPTNRRRGRWLVTAAALLAAATLGLSVGIAVAGVDDPPSRQAVVAEHGARVMPFDLEATTHVFEPDGVGGIQTVVADDPDDVRQVHLVRDHMRAEATKFRRGDFDDPADIHGHDMPGLDVLERNAARLDVTYRDIPAGSEIRYRGDGPTVVRALHDWFAAQVSDHGRHATSG